MQQLELFRGGVNHLTEWKDAIRREKKEASRLRPHPGNCCGRPMIPVWFRNKFKGYVCYTGAPMHWISTKKLGAMGYFKQRKPKDYTDLTKELMGG